jgi:hypothetical protein
LYILVDWVFTKNDLASKTTNKNQENLFYIGEQKMQVEAEELLFTHNNRIFICQNFPNQHNFSSYQQKQYYLCVLKNDDTYYNKLIKIDFKTNVLAALIKQFEEKCFKLILKSVEKKDRLVHDLTFDIFLTERLHKELMASEPTDYYPNLHGRSDINMLVTHLHFNGESPLRDLSNKFNDVTDCQVFSDKMGKDSDFKNAHDTLFELIQQQNNIHNVINDREVDLIQGNANLVPLLRPYQINAVKWMLNKEKYDFSSLDSEWLSKVCFLNRV